MSSRGTPSGSPPKSPKSKSSRGTPSGSPPKSPKSKSSRGTPSGSPPDSQGRRRKKNSGSNRAKFLKETLKKQVPGEDLKVGQYYYIISPIYSYENWDNYYDPEPKKPYHVFASGKCVNVNINPSSNPHNNILWAEFKHLKILKSRESSFILTIKTSDKDYLRDIVANAKEVEEKYAKDSFYFQQNRPDNINIFVKYTDAKRYEDLKNENPEAMAMCYGLKNVDPITCIGLADIGKGKKTDPEVMKNLLKLMKNKKGANKTRSKKKKHNQTKYK